MASVKVAVRVRPFNQREKDMGAKLIVQMDAKKTRLLTVKNSKEQNDGSRDKYKDFTFDHSYWSYDSDDKHYASQEQVFSDLGLDVIDSAFEGYNACVFAYGQTGSGKTFTMMGSPECQGLIPRICRQLFSRVAAGKESGASYRTEVSYLEIYNERVKDLLATDAGHSLRVREHPRLGPYVQDLSKHLVSDYDDIQECMHRGNLHRTTASTQMNDVSSRSHAIFTITFVQASYLRHNNMPSETVSKVHLVDLAGSERADATGATGQRLVEGAHINKSLVTLGSVISALADNSHQQPPDNRGQKNNNNKKTFIPYRDSVLTWLLKDSLGGNSKTIMIAAISPADCNYGETLSTLRYANRAKNIINKPTINEDPNVKLIRELREEIEKLRAQITHDTVPVETEAGVLATLQRKEAQEKVLTEKWTEKWRETQQILQEQKALGLRKSGLGVVLDSDMPHLVGIDDNLLSTGVTLYHLKEGETVIGTADYKPQPDIVLSGAGVLPLHARVALHAGAATLLPAPGAQCWLNTVLLDRPAPLSQGCILLLGRTNMFRYNDPAEAAKLRQEGSASVMNLSRLSLLSWSTTDLAASTENLNATLDDGDTERIEAQRAEMERSRQQFLRQQQERQRRWQAERDQLLKAQKQLDEERAAMEREYAAAVRRLSGDWRSLERGWAARRRALRARRHELRARTDKLHALTDAHTQQAEAEEARAGELRAQAQAKRDELEDCVRAAIRQIRGQAGDENLSPSDSTSETSTECLMQLLQQCEPATALSIQHTVDRRKKELEELEEELECRSASVASHRVKAERLQAELSLLHTQQLGLRHALAADLSPPHAPRESEVEAWAGVKRSKSELALRTPREEHGPLSADERDHYRNQKMSLSLSLDPLPSPGSTLNTEESFHTASCSSPKPFPGDAPPAPAPAAPGAPAAGGTVPGARAALPPGARAAAPAPDDSDDMSSTEDYHRPRIVEGQSSSSVERSPEERQNDRQRTKYRRRTSEAKSGRRQVTEAEALRAMQRLCARIASQKLLVISSLENDCSKEELNRQIAVLQELQKKYVRLEMALQYSFFDTANNRRPMMVTPIQETPSLTLSESDMHVATEEHAPNADSRRSKPASSDSDCAPDAHTENGHIFDPLLNRLKEQDMEGSDNVSTSNDELPPPDPEPARTEPPLPDPTISLGIIHPVDYSQVISIPGWVTRGAGAGTHHEYEVRVTLPDCHWMLLRRYRRFRDLCLTSRRLLGPKVAHIPFPPRQLWQSEGVARARRPLLEAFLRRVLTAAARDPACALHRAPLAPDALRAFSPFFRKGVFESGKCGTG